MEQQNLSALILAAGKGTRMKSDLAKVLHPILNRPLLAYVLDAAKAAGCEKLLTVVGHQADAVRKKFAGQGVSFVLKEPQLGTGHAVAQAARFFAGYTGTVLILCGDVPLLKPETLLALVQTHHAQRADVTVMTVILEDPGHYGRVIKDQDGQVVKIVEARDATESEKAVREINTGIYCVQCPYLFEAVDAIGNVNAQKEYYLTDIIEISRCYGKKAVAFVASDPGEVMGINTPDELAVAAQILKHRNLSKA